ncbi:MAG: KH domain-containing protein [Candidatus Pacearchaeota archaeon]
MQILNIKTIKKIEAKKLFLEKKLKVKIEISGKKIETSGGEYEKYIAEKVFEAIDKNFSLNTALLLQNEDYIFESINIKNYTRKKDISTVIARILGKKGRTIQLIGELSECELTLSDNTVSIIGPTEKIKDVVNAVISLIQGSKTSKVYAYLEKARRRLPETDLGLKIKKKQE